MLLIRRELFLCLLTLSQISINEAVSPAGKARQPEVFTTNGITTSGITTNNIDTNVSERKIDVKYRESTDNLFSTTENSSVSSNETFISEASNSSQDLWVNQDDFTSADVKASQAANDKGYRKSKIATDEEHTTLKTNVTDDVSNTSHTTLSISLSTSKEAFMIGPEQIKKMGKKSSCTY